MEGNGVRRGPAGAGKPPRPGAHGLPSSFSGAQGLRKSHRPSGEVQLPETAPGPGGPGEQAGHANSK